MTIRNWLIGYYIVEFEQKGEDRARYGDNLINVLVEKLKGSVYGISATNLRLYRQFYNIYPEIGQTLSDFFKPLLIIQMRPEEFQINLSLIDKLNETDVGTIHQTVSDKLHSFIYETMDKFAKVSVVTKKYGLAPEKLLKRLSFSHIVELS